MNPTLDQFRLAIENAGLPPPDNLIPDGAIHRFSTNGHHDDDSGWYTLHDDGVPAGVFGDWRTGLKQTWCGKSENKLTPKERRAHQERITLMQRQREEEEQRRHAEAAEQARELCGAGTPAIDHPYLTRKQIQGHGVRVHHDGRLMVPMYDADNQLHSLQFIGADGDKLFLAGGRTKGLLHLLGTVEQTLYIAEGYATAASIFEATDHPVAIAFSAYNLPSVALALRAKHPTTTIIIAGDHDKSGTGQTKAREAAAAVGGIVVIPDTVGQDWNDVHVQCGLTAMKEQLMQSTKQGASPSEVADFLLADASVHPWTNTLVMVRTAPPKAVWMLEGIIPAQAVTLISGREGTMKSWLAMDWAAAIAEGRPWLGRETEAGNVCYVDAEMPGDLLRARLYEVGPSLNFNVMTWQDDGFPWQLDHPAMQRAAKEHKFIILDTLRRFMQGLDENSSNDMAIITAKLRLLTKWGAALLVLHHGIKDKERGGYRGSTEIGANVDIVMNIEKKTQDSETQLILEASKTRYSDDPRIVLKVEKNQSRPMFSDITGDVKQAKALAKEEDLRQLEALMVELTAQNGRAPIQSELVGAAEKAGYGSRATILGKLRDGEDKYWVSYPTGRSRAYKPPTCLTLPHKGELYRLDRSRKPVQPVYPPIEKTIRQVDMAEVDLDH